MANKIEKRKSGFIALTAVLLLSAVLIYIISGLAMQVLDSGEIGLAHEKSTVANYMSEACAEYVLYKLSQDPDFTTKTTNTLGGESCDFVIGEGANQKAISITSEIGTDNYTNETSIIVSFTTPEPPETPEIIIDSWDKNTEL